MRHSKIVLFLFLWIIPGFIQGSTIDPRCHRSTEGKEFWFGFMQGRNLSGQHYLEVTITAREAASFSIFIGKSATAYITGNVAANGSTQIRLPLNLAEPTGSETVQDKGIRLVSDNPVNVYTLNWDSNSADVAVVYPVASLGTEHFAMCYTPNVHNNVLHGRNSQFLIVASDDNTTVLITPSVVTDGGRPAKVSFQVILNKGEVYQVQSLNQRNLPGQGDLTGSFIESDKPVAVYSGSFSTTIPATSGMSGYDHLHEQVPPLQTWGREYYAVPLRTRQADRYRVMASANNTSVWIGNNPALILNRGEYHEFILNQNQPSRIFADRPILVAQFSQSNNTDRDYTGGNGDPFMIILSSVSQTINDVTFVAYNSNQIRTFYVNVVALTSETGHMELDGASIAHHFQPFPGTKYSYAQISINSGTYRLRSTNQNRGFLAYVYGYGGFESYGYGVGFNLDLVLDLGQSINFDGDKLVICHGESIVLDAGPYFDNFLWSTGETTQEITVASAGLYSATATTIDGCIQHDEIDIVVSKPEIDLGADQSDCAPFSVQLDAGKDFERYAWRTGETTRSITANYSDKFHVMAWDKYGCLAKDSMQLTVFPRPQVRIEGDALICGSQDLDLHVRIEGAPEDTWKGQPFTWQASHPEKFHFTNSGLENTQARVSDYGKYEVRYELTTVDGCKANDTFSFGIFQKPTSEFIYPDDPNDQCKGYSREITYAGNATSNASFQWDFGGSTLIDQTAWDKLRVSVGVFNSNPFVSLIVEENGCWSDMTRKPLGANPDFTMNTLKSRGCDAATIEFSGELKVPDALHFQWDFGDGSPGSNLQNPTHDYTGIGSYHVSLDITNLLTGCKIGFLIEDMVKIFPTPVAAISADPTTCYDEVIDLHYTNRIDSSFCYWDFDGARMMDDRNESVSVMLEDQIATIRLQVEEFGCRSAWAESIVKRKPIFDMIADSREGCQPLTVAVRARTDDEMIDFMWMTDSLNTPGNINYLDLKGYGDFSVTLSAFSNLTGCSDILIENDLIKVHPKPVAAFEVDFPAAILGQSDLSFSNHTQFAEKYQWDFGDGGTSREVNPRYHFTSMGKFPVSLTAESSFGCTDQALMMIEILPFNVFTPNAFRPDSDIPENRVFMPFTIGVDPQRFHLQIYNRWGELVFESRSPDHKWDGKLRNSYDAPVGNYVWMADYTDIQGFMHTRKGQVLLVR